MSVVPQVPLQAQRGEAREWVGGALGPVAIRRLHRDLVAPGYRRERADGEAAAELTGELGGAIDGRGLRRVHEGLAVAEGR